MRKNLMKNLSVVMVSLLTLFIYDSASAVMTQDQQNIQCPQYLTISTDLRNSSQSLMEGCVGHSAEVQQWVAGARISVANKKAMDMKNVASQFGTQINSGAATGAATGSQNAAIANVGSNQSIMMIQTSVKECNAAAEKVGIAVTEINSNAAQCPSHSAGPQMTTMASELEVYRDKTFTAAATKIKEAGLMVGELGSEVIDSTVRAGAMAEIKKSTDSLDSNLPEPKESFFQKNKGLIIGGAAVVGGGALLMGHLNKKSKEAKEDKENAQKQAQLDACRATSTSDLCTEHYLDKCKDMAQSGCAQFGEKYCGANTTATSAGSGTGFCSAFVESYCPSHEKEQYMCKDYHASHESVVETGNGTGGGTTGGGTTTASLPSRFSTTSAGGGVTTNSVGSKPVGTVGSNNGSTNGSYGTQSVQNGRAVASLPSDIGGSHETNAMSAVSNSIGEVCKSGQLLNCF